MLNGPRPRVPAALPQRHDAFGPAQRAVIGVEHTDALAPGDDDHVVVGADGHRAGSHRQHRQINAIFVAFDLAEEKQINKRVAAVLLFLRDA